MKAPEKIYIFEEDFQNKDNIIMYGVNQDKNINNLIEYTRTDVVIKNAYEWLKSNLYNYAGEDDKHNIVPFDDSVFEDFKNYMKGE